MSFRYIFEDLNKFDTTDYQEEYQDVIDTHAIADFTYKYFPKTNKELKELVYKKISINPEKPFLSDINTGNITDMSDIFSHYPGIKNIDLRAWDVSNVTDMHHMFAYCSSLVSVNLSNWDVRMVENMSAMFHKCTNLEIVDIGSGWDTDSLTYANYMFSECKKLKTLKLYITTQSLEYFNYMFSESNIEVLDIGGFSNFGNFKSAMCMFKDASIQKLTISNDILYFLCGFDNNKINNVKICKFD